jgi:hypothetical protein
MLAVKRRNKSLKSEAKPTQRGREREREREVIDVRDDCDAER